MSGKPSCFLQDRLLPAQKVPRDLQFLAQCKLCFDAYVCDFGNHLTRNEAALQAPGRATTASTSRCPSFVKFFDSRARRQRTPEAQERGCARIRGRRRRRGQVHLRTQLRPVHTLNSDRLCRLTGEDAKKHGQFWNCLQLLRVHPKT